MEHLTGLTFIRGIYSWTNAKMKEFIHYKCKKFNNNIMSVKRITKFNDSFFRIKVYTHNFNYKKFKKYLKIHNLELKFCIVDVLNGIIMFFFGI